MSEPKDLDADAAGARAGAPGGGHPGRGLRA